MRAGVYVHFPWCLARCPYCDFATAVWDEIPHARYAKGVIAELERRLGTQDLSGRTFVSVYFGGGTPSLWEPRWLARVLDAIAARLPLEATAEITLEANPGQVVEGRLADLRAAGINRVSFGTQSFSDAGLAALGRWHRATDSARAPEVARAAGIENVSVDLIYAFPGQTPEAATEDARRAAATGASHVSTYCLTLEARVPMAREVAAGRVRLPDEEAALAIEAALFSELAAAGFERYEISNHAREGRRAIHNSLYWSGGEYLGLGASASGFLREGAVGRRWRNHPSAAQYLERVERGLDPAAEVERLEAETLLR
ncbi:MAG: radical SAM family heme chaperone HemW, partial [Deltaproteobacteria bacterium]